MEPDLTGHFLLGLVGHNEKNTGETSMLRDWRFVITAAIFFTGILLTCLETNAQSIPKEIAARTEIYAIPSLTISDQQFLTGDANGKQVTVAGEFRIAAAC
jgi:hypothetical protein